VERVCFFDAYSSGEARKEGEAVRVRRERRGEARQKVRARRERRGVTGRARRERREGVAVARRGGREKKVIEWREAESVWSVLCK
jgi:hypothetical protein